MPADQTPRLIWSGKGDCPEGCESQLVEMCELACGDDSGNLVVHGENLAALGALAPEFSGKVQCIYIDPPYNTGQSFEHYEDGEEHARWLSMMRDRLVLMRELLSDAGFLCCHIDDSESHYLKVLLDEIFGRSNYLSTLYVQVRYPQKTLKQDMDFHKQIEHVHVYRKTPAARPNLTVKTNTFEKYVHRIEELAPGQSMELGGKRVTLFKKGEYVIQQKEGCATGLKEIWATGTILDGNSSGRFFRDYLTGRAVTDGLGALYKVEGIGDDSLAHRYFTGPRRATATKGRYYQGVPASKLDAATLATAPIENYHDLAASFGNCTHEGSAPFRCGKKPEKLLQLILQHFSNEGDLVLDAFAGSGTTGAVAHKMRRRYILMEQGEQCLTHIIPRLERVVGGEDQTGISKVLKWTGGGGFRVYGVK